MVELQALPFYAIRKQDHQGTVRISNSLSAHIPSSLNHPSLQILKSPSIFILSCPSIKHLMLFILSVHHEFMMPIFLSINSLLMPSITSCNDIYFHCYVTVPLSIVNLQCSICPYAISICLNLGCPTTCCALVVFYLFWLSASEI